MRHHKQRKIAHNGYPESTGRLKQLLAELAASDGLLTIERPTAELRAAYRRAINRANRELAGSGRRILDRGRDDGNLVVRLVAEPPVDAESVIAVPASVNDPHPTVRALMAQPGFADMDGAVRDRAQRLMGALVREVLRRGYAVSPVDGEQPGIRIAIGADSFDLAIGEIYRRHAVASPEAVASAKYEWQRVPTEYVSAPTGRVRIALLGPGKGDWWADRSGSPVDGKLGVILAKIEADAAASAERRRVNEEEFRRRHAEWEQAVAVARERYVQELNERRMDEQVAAWRRAKDIRSYAAQLEDRVDAASDDEAGERTATGLDRSTLADQLDPLARSGQLAWTEPDEIASSELDRFMPRGQSVTRPPT